MDPREVDEVYQLLAVEGDDSGDLESTLLGWLDRSDLYYGNVIHIGADWEAGTVIFSSDLDVDWSAELSIADLSSILKTRRLAVHLQGDGESSIPKERAEDLRRYGVRVDDLERWGVTVED